MTNDNKYTPLNVKKWDKESLMKVLEEQYRETVYKLLMNKRLTIKQKKEKLTELNINFMGIYEPVVNDRITYKKTT